MKINWGAGIVIAMVIFMSFILVLVIKMSVDKDYNYDLVIEDYYKEELAFQKEIDGEQNLTDLSEKIIFNKVVEGCLVKFPSEIEASKINGTVYLYRPSNKNLDFELPLVLSGTDLLIPANRLLDGRWNIRIKWTYENVDYIYKKSITY